MQDSGSTDYNEVNEAVERFEQMEVNRQKYFFDVHSIENIFDFYADKLQLEKADRVLELGIRMHPQATSLKVRKASMYIEKGFQEKALSLLKDLLLLEPSNPEVYLNLGWLYLRMKQTTEAFGIFDQGIASAFNEDEDCLLDVALYLNQFRQFNQTIKIFEPRRKRIGRNEELLFELAFAYDKVDKPYVALSIYRQLLDLNPFAENAWYNKGLLMVKIGEIEKGCTCFEYTLALNPHHSEAYFNRGNCLAQSNRYQEALDSYLDFISYQPGASRGLHYIADCWDHLNNHDLAPQFYTLAVKSDPMDFYAWQAFANYYLSTDEPDQCREVIKMALKVEDLFYDNTKAELYFISAQSYILDENWRMAKMYFKKAVIDDPYTFKYLFDLYQLQKALNPGYTLHAFQKHYRADFFLMPSFNYMMAAYYIFELEDLKNGTEQLREAIQINPASFEQFVDNFPKLNDLLDNYPKLAHLIDKHIN
jgi:tetratricopeptide (TPR) repeat protein